MNELKTKASFSSMATRWTCDLCGESTDKSHAVVALYGKDEEPMARQICERCIEAGPKGAAQRMDIEAHDLRRRASWLEELTPRVGSITEWATLDDMRRVEREAFEQDDVSAQPLTMMDDFDTLLPAIAATIDERFELLRDQVEELTSKAVERDTNESDDAPAERQASNLMIICDLVRPYLQNSPSLMDAFYQTMAGWMEEKDAVHSERNVEWARERQRHAVKWLRYELQNWPTEGIPF